MFPNYVINGTSVRKEIDKYLLTNPNKGVSGPSKEYIIITPDVYSAAADSLAQWKRQLGYSVEVVSQATWTNTQIQDAVQQRYQNWTPKPDYVVIIGDHDLAPGEIISGAYGNFATDLYMVCMDGSSDYYPDMAKGRISVSSSTEAMNTVLKIINYERNPPTLASYYTNAVNCAYFQESSTAGYAERRFAQTSEDIRDYVNGVQGYNVERIYYTGSSTTPTNWNNGYYSAGEALPSYLLKPTFAWDGDATDINNSINSGVFYTFHRDHGDVSLWGDPSYNTTDMNGLSNVNLTTVVFSINCLTGKFLETECFSEKFLRMQDKGAAGVFCHAEVSLSGYNDGLALGLIDAIWSSPGLVPNFTGSGGVNSPTLSSHSDIFTMGDVANQGLIRMVETWADQEYTHQLFHYFGDPAMKIWTSQPQAITATHQITLDCLTDNTFSIISSSLSDGLASLVIDGLLVGEVQLVGGAGVIDFTGIQLYGTSAVLTISQHNYQPYVATIPITGNCIYASFISDVTSTCTGVVNFTDQSIGIVDSYLWDFGDGNTSTDQNPIYTYTSDGTYSVTLIATNSNGNDTYIETNYITVALPIAPTTTDDSRCGAGSVTLTATGTGTLQWYDAATGGTLVNTGASFTTPALSATTNYYVEDVIGADTYYVGNTDNNSNGAYYTSDRCLIFNALTDLVIESVEVNADGAGDRTVILRNSIGTVIESTIINIPDGVSRITLDFAVPTGTDYELAITGTTDLWRNSTGVSYPYTEPGVLSITGSSATSAYYYFFYDWEVKVGEDCISSRTPSIATIETELSVSNVVAASVTSICTGDNVDFTATPTNGGATPSYQWQVNSGNVGTDSDTYSTTSLADGNIVTCILTSSESCNDGPATSNSINMTVVSNLPASVSIAGNNTICDGETVVIDATPANEGASPSYEWFINGSSVGNDNPTYTSTSFADGDVITCVLTSSFSCATGNPATSNAVTMTVNPNLAVSVSISGVNTICDGVNVAFAATPTNGGSTPIYEWQVNGSTVGTNNSIYSSTAFADGDIVTCILTSSEACNDGPATSNSIIMTVAPNLPVSILIDASTSSICTGDNAVFTATSTNGGTTPAYQWQVNGSNVGTGSTYSSTTLNDGDIVTCIITSSETCNDGPATSNSIIMTVASSLPTSVLIAGNNTICDGETVIIDATPINEGASPIYEWFINGSSVGNDNPTYTSTSLVDGDIITCVLTSSLSCATGNPASSNAVTMIVNPSFAVSLSIVGNNTICDGENVAFAATPTNGGATPIYEWQVNGSTVGTNNSTYSSTTFNDGDIVTCILISSEVCNDGPATSNSITMTVSSSLPASVIIAGSTAICAGDDNTYTATPTNGGTTPTYEWQVNGFTVGTNSDTYTTSLLNVGDIITCTLTSSEACATSNPATSNTLTVITVDDYPTAGFYYATNFLDVNFTNNSTNAVSYSWDFGDGNTSTDIDPSHTYANDGTYTVTLIATNGCGDDTITINISVIGVSIADIPKLSDVEIYPNPTSGLITIDLHNNKVDKLEIFDVVGKLQYSKVKVNNITKLNLDKLNKGIYFIKLINKDNSSVYKIIVN